MAVAGLLGLLALLCAPGYALLLHQPSLQRSRLSTCATVADTTDGFLTPQQIKTLRKEIDDRRKRGTLDRGWLEDGEGAADPFTTATLDSARSACDATEFFEIAGPPSLNPKRRAPRVGAATCLISSNARHRRWPEIAFALALEVDAMVVQLKKRKAVLYQPMPPGTPGAVVLWASGREEWQPRPRAVRDERGRILGREGDASDTGGSEDAR